MKKYNHMFSIGFSVHSDRDADNLSDEEIMQALLERVKDIQSHSEIKEAAGWESTEENGLEI